MGTPPGGLYRSRSVGTMTNLSFHLIADVSSDRPSAIRPLLEQLVGMMDGVFADTPNL